MPRSTADAGPREAKLGFNVGQGTQDLGFRSDVDILFQCAPAREVKLRVLDENGKPATAMFVVRDQQQRVYPSQAKRLAPDFAFQPQVYRADGLPAQIDTQLLEDLCAHDAGTRMPQLLHGRSGSLMLYARRGIMRVH